jgi:hypothetical protein
MADPIGPFSQDVLTGIYNVHWAEKGPATLSLGFSATPTGFYKDGTPTVVTLSVKGLPLLSPSTFKVNLPEGATPPPFFDAAYYGGRTELTVPDGESGTLTANWSLEQKRADGTAFGEVNYVSSTANFRGENKIRIEVVMVLRPLDFLSLISLDNHYDWHAFAVAIIPGIAPAEKPMSESGRAETGQALTFTLDVIVNPPSAKFTAGQS